MYYVYVLDSSGVPLMPTTRYGKVRRMLKTGQAVAVCTKPFTIRLTYEPVSKVTQPVTLGIDPGRTNIGLAAVREDGVCLYAVKCETRNKQVAKLMMERAAHRRASRRGERLARKRLAKKLGTTTRFLNGRMLPGCEKPVLLKDIINTESRFNNRSRPEGWLTPTATQLLRTHLNLVEKVRRLLPVNRLTVELNRLGFNHHQVCVVRSLKEADGIVEHYGFLCSIRTDRDFGITKDLPFYLVESRQGYQAIRMELQKNLDAKMILIISNGRYYDAYLRYNLTFSVDRDGSFQAEYCTRNIPLRHMHRYPSELVFVSGNINERFGNWGVSNRSANQIDLREIRQLLNSCYLKVEKSCLYGRNLELSVYRIPCGILQEYVSFWEI